MQHAAQPEQTQQHQLVEKEVGYHCVAPFHGGETGALYLFCRLLNGRVPIFPVRLRAEPGAKWPYVSTGSTAPPCSTSARARWPRHWHDTRTCSVLSSAG